MFHPIYTRKGRTVKHRSKDVLHRYYQFYKRFHPGKLAVALEVAGGFILLEAI